MSTVYRLSPMGVCEQGISNAWELIDTDEAVRSIRYLLSYQREADGAFPQQVSPTGATMFGQEGRNLTLDSAPFAARTVVMIAERTTNESFFEEYATAIKRGLDPMPLSSRGLVWNDPANPAIGYGFHDSVLKSGEVLYSSLLYVDACMGMSRLHNRTGQLELGRQYWRRAAAVHKALTPAFWNESSGLFHASAGGIEAGIADVFGSTYACILKVASVEQCEKVSRTLIAGGQNIIYEGAIRETPAPGYWAAQFKDQSGRPKGTYDQGGYWGTNLDHVLPVVALVSKAHACQILLDAIHNFQSVAPIEDSFLEWQFGPKGRQGPPCNISAGPNPCAATGYVATAAAAYRASTLLNCSGDAARTGP